MASSLKLLHDNIIHVPRSKYCKDIDGLTQPTRTIWWRKVIVHKIRQMNLNKETSSPQMFNMSNFLCAHSDATNLRERDDQYSMDLMTIIEEGEKTHFIRQISRRPQLDLLWTWYTTPATVVVPDKRTSGKRKLTTTMRKNRNPSFASSWLDGNSFRATHLQ